MAKATVRIVIESEEDEQTYEGSIESSDATEVARFMAESLRGWTIDEDVTIYVNGKKY
jgi:hypothetical protein